MDVAVELLTATAAAPAVRPLVVDLDGTLIRSDLLIETAFAELGRQPLSGFRLLRALISGKAALKHLLAETAELDPATLPYDEVVLDRIRQARAQGRPVWLASASNARLVGAIADHLGLFDGWLASDATNNLAGVIKARALAERFGHGGFDYIGNDTADLPVWAEAGHALAIRTSPRVARRLAAIHPDAEHLPSARASLKTWLKLMRVHQYAKNALVFVPLLTAHAFTPEALLQSILALLAFSLCASSVYLLNDLLDLAADRAHLTKRRRPLASGMIPLMDGILAVPVLFLASLAVAIVVSPTFLGVLLGYFALTTAYSLVLKRKMLIDAVALALLYAFRVVGGAVAINVAISEWLIAFSLFIFMALALVKRYIELSSLLDRSLPDPSNRNYKTGDLPIVAALAAASGFNAVTILTLYLSSDAVHSLYNHPQLLWLLCPVLMFWFGRVLLMAHRRLMHDDPIVFALRDRVSRHVLLASVGIVLAATF